MSETRRLSAVTRVALAMIIATTIGASAISLIAYTSMSSRIHRDIDRTLLGEVDAFGAAIGGQTADGFGVIDTSRNYLEARSESSGDRNVILLAIFNSGKVLSNSSMALESVPGNTAASSSMSSVAGLSNVTDGSTTYRIMSVPITGPDDVRMGVFQAALSTDESDGVLNSLAAALGISSVVVIALATLLSSWVASKALSPLRRMAETAAHVSTSSLHERTGYAGPPDELGVLAHALDSMLDRLETSFDEQKRFVADASHELRTPLTIISGHLEAVESQIATDASTESLEIARDEAERMSRLVEDLLALARLDAGPPRPFQPLHATTLTEEIAHRASSIGARSVQLTCSGDMWVMGDPDLLERAIMNLITNAFRHTPETAAVALMCEGEGSRVLVRVMDNGPGISDEDLPRLFDRFYRARDPRGTGAEGAGLGLAIVKRLIELHGGSVKAENSERGGAVFTISLPTIPRPA